MSDHPSNKLYKSYQWIMPFELGTQNEKKVIIRNPTRL
jgi:hypothetical protein